MATSGGILYASTAAGLDVYRAGSITDLPVTVTVQVPTTTGVSIVANSFNVAPTQITTRRNLRDAHLGLLLAGRHSQRRHHLADERFQSAGGPGPARDAGHDRAIYGPGQRPAAKRCRRWSLAGVPDTQTLTVPVEVVVPGVTALANAAVAAGQIGNTGLATQFSDLSIALTDLVQTPPARST